MPAIVAAAGTALMAVLGAVYSWSLYAQPLAQAFGWSARTTTGAFSTAIFFLGVGAIAGGHLQDRLGPRPVALCGAGLWALREPGRRPGGGAGRARPGSTPPTAWWAASGWGSGT